MVFFDVAGGVIGTCDGCCMTAWPRCFWSGRQFGVIVLEIMSQTSDEHFWFCGKYLLLALMSMWCWILSDVNAYCMFASKLV